MNFITGWLHFLSQPVIPSGSDGVVNISGK